MTISTAFLLLLPTSTLILSFLNRVSTPDIPEGEEGSKRRLWVGDFYSAWVAVWVMSFLLMLTDRPWSSLGIGVLLAVLLWAGNAFKVKMLAEPLVFSDVFLAGHALRYPRLYFGYAPKWVWPLLLLSILLLGCIVLAEKPMTTPIAIRSGLGVLLFLGAVLTVLWLVKGLFCDRLLKIGMLSFNAVKDASRYTPIGAAFLHMLWHGRYRMEIRNRFTAKNTPCFIKGKSQEKSERPHIVLIQAESFCDIAALLNRPSVTPTIDRIREEGMSGPLKLDWRGAYTMRSEFAVLTGHAPEELETYGFDPYRLAAMIPMESIATSLKSKGYRTIVWHPNDGRFFDRFHVMPHLGFDEFRDIEAFKGMQRFGRHVSDEALLTEAAEYLQNKKEPTFLFIITMEAHGPWDAASFEGAELLGETERYEAHLTRLDKGVAALLRMENRSGPKHVLMVYGDHCPGLKALQVRKNIAAQTLWIMKSCQHNEKSQCESVEVEHLSAMLTRNIS